MTHNEISKRRVILLAHVVLASHGRLSEGMLDTLRIILGELPNVTTLCAYVNENVSLKAQVDEALASVPAGERLIVVTDLFGGSVNNEFMTRLSDHDFTLVSGMNMPLLVELLSCESPGLDDVRDAVSTCAQSILVCNDLADPDETEEF
jgi:fructoselysine and glucoselysine-specific PTS system IIA component